MPRMVKKTKMLTPRQFAELHGVAYTTVMNWLQQGLIPEAVKQETLTQHYWEVPETAKPPKLQPGRPPKAQAGSAVTSKKKGGKK